MAITFPTVFQSAITTDPAATAAGYLTPSRYNQGCSIAGLSSTSGALLYSTDATTLAQDATNLNYTTSSGPRLQVGSGSGTSNGWILGYFGSSGLCGMWSTALTPTTSNYAVAQDSTGSTYFNSAGAALNFRFGATTKASFASTAGSGFNITAGTATTDVQALSATQTWNASGVAFTGIKFTITDTASAAGSKAMEIFTGASGTTSIFKLFSTGKMDVGVQDSLFMQGLFTGQALISSGSTGFGDIQFLGTSWGSNGIFAVRGGANAVAVRGAGTYAWENGANNPTSGTLDTGLSRNAAGIVEVNNGTAGTFRDLKLRNLSIGSTLATNQTDGFINIAGASGAASGTPNNTTGVPLYYDTSANKLMAYNGGWKTLATAFA